jgi:hypothetical protein
MRYNATTEKRSVLSSGRGIQILTWTKRDGDFTTETHSGRHCLTYNVGSISSSKTWGMTPRLTVTEDRSHLRLCLIPKNLLTAIWLEFAESIDEQTRFLQCGGCGKWLPMPVHTTRDRRYCAEACRMRAMRGRKFKAHELAKQGVPAPQIAEQLGSKIAVVKKWIKEPAPLQRRAQNRA